MRKVCIVYRDKKPEAKRLANEVALWLHEKGLKTFSHPKQQLERSKKLSPVVAPDLVVVLGGDGTYLEAVRMLQGQKTPILGVNLGSLGFLTQTRMEDLYGSLTLALNDKMDRRRRSMLEVQLRRDGKVRGHYTALNDVVVERGSHSRLISVGLYIEQHLITQIKADGVLVSTPTGSTAYNLAAGGPILHPEVDAVVVNPICSHSLTLRPIILPDKKRVIFRLKEKGQKAFLTVDGKYCDEITVKDELVCERGPHDHTVLRKPSHNYFDLLREKLKFGERA